MSEGWKHLEPLVHSTFGRLLDLERKLSDLEATQVSSPQGCSPGANELRDVLESLVQRLDKQEAEMGAQREEIMILRGKVMTLEDENTALRSVVGSRNQPKKLERYYQNFLAAKLGYGHCPIERVGVTDITTPDAHIEIKKWADYQMVIGQLAKYQQALPRTKKAVYFFGDEPGNERFGQIVALMKDADVEMYSFDANDNIRKHDVIETARRDDFDDFQSECLVVEKGAVIKIKDLYPCFQQWATRNNRAVSSGTSTLKALFEERLGKAGNHRYGHRPSDTIYGWKHLKISPVPCVAPDDTIDTTAKEIQK